MLYQKDFTDLYQGYLDQVFRYLYCRLGSIEDAEDLCSQTFLQAYRSYNKLRDPSRFAPWLFTIARNKLMDFYRSQKPTADLVQEKLDDKNPQPSEAFELNQDLISLREHILALPEEDQELIRLRYLGELTYREIGEVLGKSEQAAKKSIYRLLARLKSQME